MTRQLHAGYVLSGVRRALAASSDDMDWSEVLRWLCAFTIEDNLLEELTEEPIAAVMANVISRGLPTYASPRVERAFSKRTRVSKKVDSDGTGEFDWILTSRGTDLLPLIKRALAPVVPMLDPSSVAMHPESK